jgi:hypothetical protein
VISSDAPSAGVSAAKAEKQNRNDSGSISVNCPTSKETRRIFAALLRAAVSNAISSIPCAIAISCRNSPPDNFLNFFY